MIGLTCDSGIITDCNISLKAHRNFSSDIVPAGCEKQLFFSEANSSCGSYCDFGHLQRRSAESFIRKGWTLYTSVDKPDGTGDHENYFQQSKDVYELNGSKYTKCKKKAVHIRSRSKHEPWYSLSGIYSDIIFLFSKNNVYRETIDSPDDISYTRVLSPDYG